MSKCGVWILVGPAGAGKSTLARQMVEENPSLVSVEADSYFVGEDGTYQFDPTKLSAAHSLCLAGASAALAEGKGVVVANTNLTRWERKRYHDLAAKFGVRSVEVWLPIPPIGELVSRNIHGLDVDAIARQLHKTER